MSDELKIEVIKWHQRIQEITYLEAGQHMRALNQLMWQVPSFVIAINGGLWYGTTLVSEIAARAIFFMVFVFDLMSIITLYRLRLLLNSKIKFQKNVEEQFAEGILSDVSFDHFHDIYLRHVEYIWRVNEKEKLDAKNEKSFLANCFQRAFSFITNHTNGNYTVIGCWSTVLFLCAAISLTGGILPSTFLDKADKAVKYEVKNLTNGDIITVIKQ